MIPNYSHAGTMMTKSTPYSASIKRTTEGRPSEVGFTDGHIQRTVWDMAGNKLSTEYLVEADAIALGEGLSPAEPGDTEIEGGISGIDTTVVTPGYPILPTIHLYTREYTGDGHVIKAKESYTWTGTDTTRVIESIQFDGGYFDSGSGANYYVKDYLGNIIAVVNQGGHLVQATDYYPYGLPFRMLEASDTNAATSGSTDKTVNRYLFGGKEFLTEDGLNEYNQEARQYIPRIPRFDRMDDLSEKWYEYSPYLPFAGNPIMNLDPDGRAIIFSGNEKDVETVLNILNSGFNGTATFTVNEMESKKWKLAVNYSEKIPKNESRAQLRHRGAIRNLCEAINDPILVKIGIVESATTVLFGNVDTGQIDIEDIKKLDPEGPGGQLSALGHELIEQYKKAIIESGENNETPDNINKKAHSSALSWEGNLNDVAMNPREPTGYRDIPYTGYMVIS